MTVDVLPVDVEGNVSRSWPLVVRAQQGDREAFGLIYDQYAPAVRKFLYFRVGNVDTAEDLTQDTFLRAFKRIGSFTWQGRDLGAWLTTIARNLVADHFKCGRSRLEFLVGDGRVDAAGERWEFQFDGVDQSPEGSPESVVVEHFTNVALLEAVKRLNPQQQECIVLRFLRGYSIAETAEAMRKNEGAVKALQGRAVRALGRLLEPADAADPSAGFIAHEATASGPAEPLPPPWAAPARPCPAGEVRGPSVETWTALSAGSDQVIRQWAASKDIPAPRRGKVSQRLRDLHAAELAGAR